MKRKIVNIIMMAAVLCVSPTVTSGQVAVYAAEGEYILPDSDSRAYTYEELSGLSAQEIRLAKNELYARHGWIFKSADLQDYFNSKSWYHGTVMPDDFSDSVFNVYEKNNVDLLSAMEKGEASGNTGNNAGTDAGADSVSRMLKGEFVSLGSSFSLDLDQDGTAENIQMSVQSSGNGAQDSYNLQAGAAGITNNGENTENNLYGVSLDGKNILLIVYENGPSDDPKCTFYKYKGSSLSNLGQILSWPENMKVENGEIHTKVRCNIMGTEAMEASWKMDQSGNLTMIPQDYYNYSRDFTYPGTPDDYVVTLKQELSVYAEMNTDSEEIWLEPQMVAFPYTDGEDWVYVQGEDGNGGWLEVGDWDYQVKSEVFEGLFFAD